MAQIKCLIVDDEPIARQIVRGYCDQLPNIDVIAECDSALKAMSIVQDLPVDLIFLDINMPVLNGLSMIKTMTQKPKIILTTAYKEYALDAFDLLVSDYLLKPFSFERFVQAVAKVQNELKPYSAVESSVSNMVNTQDFDGAFFKIGKMIYRFKYEDILFFEAQRNYTRIVTIDDDVQVYSTLTDIENTLPLFFVRSHRSYIVNKNHVSKIDGNVIMIKNHEVVIGPKSRDEFLEKLGLI